MKKVFYLTVFIVNILFANSVFAIDSSMDRLINYLQKIDSYQAGFVQTLYDTKGVEIQRSRGLVYIEKPGKFRWDYKKPYQQLILSDAKKIWIYDVEMEQVTVKDAKVALGSAPASLLGSNKPLNESFELRDMGHREGLDWIQLLPKKQDTDFEKIFVGMNTDGVSVMELHDSLSHITQIQFHHMETNKSLDKSLFQFTPPENVDVLGQ